MYIVIAVQVTGKDLSFIQIVGDVSCSNCTNSALVISFVSFDHIIYAFIPVLVFPFII